MTIRERVKAIAHEVLGAESLTPARASELDLMLSSLIGNVLDERRAADSAYRLVLLAAMRAEAKANRAKILAETSPEYARLREAEDVYKVTLQLSRALSRYLRTAQEEMRLAK